MSILLGSKDTISITKLLEPNTISLAAPTTLTKHATYESRNPQISQVSTADQKNSEGEKLGLSQNKKTTVKFCPIRNFISIVEEQESNRPRCQLFLSPHMYSDPGIGLAEVSEAFHPSVVGKMVSGTSGKDQTSCPFAGHRKSLYRLNTFSNCPHNFP